MMLKSTNITNVEGCGFVLTSGLSPIFRLLVLIITIVFFIMSLSSEYASRDEFRILVIALSVVLMILIGPRSSVYFIQDEKVVKISKQYFVFKKSYEYELINTDTCTKNKKMYLILNDRKIVIAYSGSKIDFDYIATRIKKITEEH